MSRGYLDPEVARGFSQHHNQVTCGWCADALEGRTAEEFRERIFNAVTSCIGLPIVGQYRAAPSITPFFHETNGRPGAPWSHLREGTVYAEASLLRARQVVHVKRRASTEPELRICAVPGITGHTWAPEDLQPVRRLFVPFRDLIAAAEDEIALRERREEHEKWKANKNNVRTNRDRNSEESRSAAEKALAKRLRETGVDKQIAAMRRSGVI